MERQFYVLANDHFRQKAVEMIMRAPKDARVEIKPPKRTLDQNAKFWAMLSDIAKQYAWHGIDLEPGDWRLVFLDALDRETRIVPNLAGNGFVNLSRSSSDLTVGEMSDLIELMYAWGADPAHPVRWTEPDVWGHASDLSPPRERSAVKPAPAAA